MRWMDRQDMSTHGSYSMCTWVWKTNNQMKYMICKMIRMSVRLDFGWKGLMLVMGSRGADWFRCDRLWSAVPVTPNGNVCWPRQAPDVGFHIIICHFKGYTTILSPPGLPIFNFLHLKVPWACGSSKNLEYESCCIAPILSFWPPSVRCTLEVPPKLTHWQNRG